MVDLDEWGPKYIDFWHSVRKNFNISRRFGSRAKISWAYFIIPTCSTLFRHISKDGKWTSSSAYMPHPPMTHDLYIHEATSWLNCPSFYSLIPHNQLSLPHTFLLCSYTYTNHFALNRAINWRPTTFSDCAPIYWFFLPQFWFDMGHFNKANLLVIITLTLSIFASNIVCRSFNGSVEDDSCGYMTTGYDDSDRALVMSNGDQCHTFS